MRLFFVLSIVLNFFTWSCTPCSHCASKINYIRKVDTTKPYQVEGKYCIKSIADTNLSNNKVIVYLNIYDRRNGDEVNQGVSWFYNEKDTIRLLMENGNRFAVISAGSYEIGISISDKGLLGFSTKKKLEMHENTKIQFDIYLGSSLQW